MKKESRLKSFFRDLGDGIKDYYRDLFPATKDDPNISYPTNFIAWAGTAALTIATVSSIGAGAVVPAILFGLGTATLATDVIVNIPKKQPSLIARCLVTAFSAVAMPILAPVIAPVVIAGMAIFDGIDKIKERISERREAKQNDKTTDYTKGYDKSSVLDSLTPEAPVQTHTPALTDTTYSMPEDPSPESKGYIEELEDPDFNPGDTPSSDDDVMID